MPGTTMGWPMAALRTTKVWAAMSPTRRWPLDVRAAMKPTSGKHQGAVSTMRSSQRMIARPRPGASPFSRTVRMPVSHLPSVAPVKACSRTSMRIEISSAVGVPTHGVCSEK